MKGNWLNPITLVPTNGILKECLNNLFRSKTKFLFLLACSFCLLALLCDLGWVLYCIVCRSEYWHSLAFVIGDSARMLYYLLAFLSGKFSLKIQFWFVALSSLLYSVTITELHIYTGHKEPVKGRILCIGPLFMLVLNWMGLNLVFFFIPFLLSLLYPILRLLGMAFNKPVDFDYFTILLITNLFFSSLLCAYFTRKSVVFNAREKYFSERINEQWKNTIHMLSTGILVMSNSEPYDTLYLNPAMKEILQQCYPGVRENEELRNCVQGLEVKVIEVNDNKKSARELLVNIIKCKKNNIEKKYYLDNLKDDTEINISEVIFERSKAILIAFTDCTSGRTINELRRENKNKTCLISTISHELRTPVSGVKGILELISPQVSNEAANLIERAEECCDIIVSHINDFTVFSFTNS